MKLKLRAAAERDLDGIFDYSVARYGPALAEGYVREVQAAIGRLLDFPNLGALTGLRPKLRTFGVRERRIFYQVDGKLLVIVRVLHKTMDAKRHV